MSLKFVPRPVALALSCLVAATLMAGRAHAAEPEVAAPLDVPSAEAGQDTVLAPVGEAIICDRASGPMLDAAASNSITLYAMEWTPFNQREMGWEAYVPMIQNEIGAACDPTSPGFAESLAAFQVRHGLIGNGRFDAATFGVFRGLWQERRPFVMARVRGECPAPPPIAELAYLAVEEEHAERITRLVRRDVLDAYRAMVAAARAEVPELAQNPELMRIFSSFRDPEADAARCARERNCDGVRRAVCSPHRTGTALDIYVGHLAGYGVDSTNWHSRRYMSETPAYRWMVKNAHRFGFVNYVFEPWHWEWTGVAFDAAATWTP